MIEFDYIVIQAMIGSGAPKNTTIVIAGLSNTYADYITTYEEYQVSYTQ